jgi:peroxiredoxin
MNPFIKTASCLGLALLLGGGAVRAADAGTTGETGTGPSGLYRAVLQLPGGELPFGFELRREGGSTVGYLLNGPERIKLTDLVVRGGHLEIGMPGFANRLVADADGDTLRGEVDIERLGGKHVHIPLVMEHGKRYRFFADARPGSARVAGRWSVQFIDDDGSREAAVGEFTQSGDVVTGTFLTTTGDHRYLAGQVRGRELYLSTFDGAHVFLYHATLTAAGGLDGQFWSGDWYRERWEARRDAAAALPDAYALTRLKGGGHAFPFAFPDEDGVQVSSTDPRFAGKVLIVSLAGSWCPNCHDEAAFLEPLYREYRGRGVEVVSLMFEHFGDFAQSAAATQRFRRHYGIEYTTLIAGISDKDQAAAKLPALDRVVAFPTTVFIDRSGVVRRIHTGFSGPATGAHYTELVKEFRSTLDSLLEGG